MNLDPLSSLLVAVIVLLIGTMVNRRVPLLSKYNIPGPITGGLLFAAIASVVWLVAKFKLGIDQTIKPTLLPLFSDVFPRGRPSALRRPCPIWGAGAAVDGDSSLDTSKVYPWLSPCVTMRARVASAGLMVKHEKTVWMLRAFLEGGADFKTSEAWS